MDADTIRDLFAEFGAVSVRRMFGGAGVFTDGLMIAIVSDGTLYLKADEASAGAFEREGLAPFSYATKDGRRTILSYWRMPERLYDDPDELAAWARESLAAARRKEAAPTRAKTSRDEKPRKTTHTAPRKTSRKTNTAEKSSRATRKRVKRPRHKA